MISFANLGSAIRPIHSLVHRGAVSGTCGQTILVKGLSTRARVGEFVAFGKPPNVSLGEVLAIRNGELIVVAATGVTGHAIGDPVAHLGARPIFPDRTWMGRIVDGFGEPLDGRPLLRGLKPFEVTAAAPPAVTRRPLGDRLETGLAPFNTFLPLVRGQRIGLFAGSGVGKSSLLGQFCKHVDADVIVVALIGERGREILQFVEDNLDKQARARTIIVAASSDQAAFVRKRAGLAAVTVAEYFRGLGQNVLFLCDSLTRFAEAHRDLAVTSGESLDSTGFPPSTSHAIMSLCERTGPGEKENGDITAIFSVLVPGSDMEGPLPDLVRGVLDGHVILSRDIAERGRFPAIDILRSVSRSFQAATAEPERKTISQARQSLAIYRDIEIMLQTGLYEPGSDAVTDAAIEIQPRIESFLTLTGLGVETCFDRLAGCLERSSADRTRALREAGSA